MFINYQIPKILSIHLLTMRCVQKELRLKILLWKCIKNDFDNENALANDFYYENAMQTLEWEEFLDRLRKIWIERERECEKYEQNERESDRKNETKRKRYEKVIIQVENNYWQI